MNSISTTKSKSSPLLQTLLGVLPFFISGMVDLLLHFRFPLLEKNHIDPYVFNDVFGVIILIGLGAGLLAGFPRWAYPYLCFAFYFGFMINYMDVFWARALEFAIARHVPGALELYQTGGLTSAFLMFLNSLQSFGVALGALVLLAALLKRSLAPWRSMLESFRNDWTIFSMACFTFVALIGTGIEKHNSYWMVFVVASMLAACVGAGLYLRPGSPMRRVFSLIASTIAIIIVNVTNDTIFWNIKMFPPTQENESLFITPCCFSVIFGLCLLMFLFGHLAQTRLEKHNILNKSGNEDKHLEG